MAIGKDLVRAGYQLVLGYQPGDALIDSLASQMDTTAQLRNHLLLDFDARRHSDMLKVMEFLYQGSEAEERDNEIQMDAFLDLGKAAETAIRAAIAEQTDEYTVFHRRRFFDQVRALGAIRSKVFGHLHEINVLDVGVMSVSSLYARGIGGLCLHTTDHPRRVDENARFGLQNFYPADLETEELSVKYPELAGKFHVIIFCEVLEHLKLAPHEILTDFKRLLAPGGMIYMTTPNGMAYGVFLSYFEGQSPVAQYSRINSDAHLRNYLHVREHTMRELVAEFKTADLRIRYRAFKEYYDPDTLWTNAFAGARSLLCYIADVQQ